MVKADFPDIREAMRVWEEGIQFRKSREFYQLEDEYRFHTMNIAFLCRLLASRLNGLDLEKAYICGLLHDYGKKYNEFAEKRFHGLIGYHEMMSMGYPGLAQICLSHTFPVRDFNFANYSSYPQAELAEAHRILQGLEYDDYDRIVQYCDMFLEGLSVVSPEARIKSICQRYNLSEADHDTLLANVNRLKNYFNEKCKIDTYTLFGLK